MVKNIIIIILLLILFGIGGIFVGTRLKSNSIAAIPTPTETLVGNDQDEHGCIPSAGYTWCENKQKCLRSWEENCGVMVTAIPTPTVVDTEALKVIIKQLLVAKHGNNANELTITVSAVSGNYAKGGASGSGGGGMWFAAKVNDIWKLVWDGNGTIDCPAIAPYPDLPTSWISECFDSSTKKMVNR